MIWSQEHDEVLIQGRNNGRSYKQIAAEIGRTEGACQTRGYKFIKEGLIHKEPPLVLNREQLLDLVRLYRVRDNCPNREWNLIRKEFGGWVKALEAAGLEQNCGGVWDWNKPATLYLLRFDGFYKIGVTQRQIEQRFRGAPEYEVLDTYCSDLDEILALEREILSKVEPYLPENEWFKRNGKTECFLFRDIKTLTELI